MNNPVVRHITVLILAVLAGWSGWALFDDVVEALTRGAFPKVLALSDKAEFHARLLFVINMGLLCLMAYFGGVITAKMRQTSFKWMHLGENWVIGFTSFLIAALIFKSQAKGAMAFTSEVFDVLKNSKTYILFNPLNLSAFIGFGAALLTGALWGMRGVIPAVALPKKRKSKPKARKK
ncbi:hypothetical protein N9B94_00160 [Verrucomicrobia bacterium]|nr:hypothetical protein [Verrucomicrobiota bacterium]